MANPFSTAGLVEQTAEVARILALPRRRWEETVTRGDCEIVSRVFLRPEAYGLLRPVQVAALDEISRLGGGLFPMPVGSGKTLVSFLAPKALGAKRPLLLVPAKLKNKTLAEYNALQQQWLLPAITVQSYELLSREQHSKALDLLEPDLIIADEGHRLKNTKAAVTRRVARYLRERKHRRPGVVILSGTITRKSLLEYWHLLKWCLGEENMPLPKSWEETVSWSTAIDGTSSGARSAPGALTKFLAEGEPVNIDSIRKGYQRRLVETPGVVSASNTSYPGACIIQPVFVPLGRVAAKAVRELRNNWETPDEHPFSEAVELWRHTREIACGFYYRWNPRPPRDWLDARKAWCRFVRETLKSSRTLDTELQVFLAVSQGTVKDPQETLEQWTYVKDSFKPNTEAVWLSSEALDYARDWMKSHKGIVWVEHTAFGEKLSALTGRPYYGKGGMCNGQPIENETGTLIASIAANSEGRNLQRYNENLVVSCPPSGAVWEQLIGRTHRPGQVEDEVTFDVLFSCSEQWSGFERSLEDAKYIEGTLGAPQKLNIADISPFHHGALL